VVSPTLTYGNDHQPRGGQGLRNPR
jgi:hypothetical protein